MSEPFTPHELDNLDRLMERRERNAGFTLYPERTDDMGKLKISRAAEMAGDWWAERLDDKHADKRKAFAAAVAKRVQMALDGTHYWVWGESKPKEVEPNKVKPKERIYTESDYDPDSLLLDAVHEIIDPECRGFMFSSDDLLPRKHGLGVSHEWLYPKEGYGNHTNHIRVTK
jgi:hypothetical protein